MPKGTTGGSSNAWEALEPGYVAPEGPAADVAVPVVPEPVQAVSEPPKPEPKPAPVVAKPVVKPAPVVPEPVPDAGGM